MIRRPPLPPTNWSRVLTCRQKPPMPVHRRHRRAVIELSLTGLAVFCSPENSWFVDVSYCRHCQPGIDLEKMTGWLESRKDKCPQLFELKHDRRSHSRIRACCTRSADEPPTDY